MRIKNDIIHKEKNMERQYFGAMLDMSRNAVMKPEKVKDISKILKSFGYNMIQLYTEDTFETDDEPYFGYMRGRYSKEELKDIVSYCDSIGMEVIPCVQTLAHLNQIFRWKPYFECNDLNDILLVDNDRTYLLIENIFKTLRQCFTSKYVNIGMDEAHMIGLGKYLDKNGFNNRFDILLNHLKKVIEIARKYGFKPIMWSDMFFRLANKGNYRGENPVPNEIKEITPKEVGLVYWDYYQLDKKSYDRQIKNHLSFNNEIWFAGGAWTWTGFAPGNKNTLKTMLPAMKACRSNGINNIFITMWGDNGKECSYYSVLPTLFAIKKYYDGETSIKKIKDEFYKITGESYDKMCALDLPNYVGGNDDVGKNICKYMLYNDPFSGVFDTTVKNGVTDEYKCYARRLRSYAKGSKYSYIFESEAKLCDLLSVKYDLGVKTRNAYCVGDLTELKNIMNDYAVVEKKLDSFIKTFRNLWYTDNKPYGFDVQEIRLGGLKQRIISCRERLKDFIDGKIDEIPELEEILLDCLGNGKNFSSIAPSMNIYSKICTVNIL